MSNPATGNLVWTRSKDSDAKLGTVVVDIVLFLYVFEQENERDPMYCDQALSRHYDSFWLSTLLSVPPASVLHDWENGEMLVKANLNTQWTSVTTDKFSLSVFKVRNRVVR